MGAAIYAPCVYKTAATCKESPFQCYHRWIYGFYVRLERSSCWRRIHTEACWTFPFFISPLLHKVRKKIIGICFEITPELYSRILWITIGIIISDTAAEFIEQIRTSERRIRINTRFNLTIGLLLRNQWFYWSIHNNKSAQLNVIPVLTIDTSKTTVTSKFYAVRILTPEFLWAFLNNELNCWDTVLQTSKILDRYLLKKNLKTMVCR